MAQLRQIFDQDTWTYSYLLIDRAEGAGFDKPAKAVLIDGVSEQLDLYLQLLRELNLELELAIDTHTHADHITAMGALRDVLGCRTMVGEQSGASCADLRYGDGATLHAGDLEIQVLYTPGHTDDSYSFYAPVLNALFSGDTLLIRGTGRTDFQSGDAREQWHSLQRLLALPGQTRVFPGHDYRGLTQSTLAEEKAHNPRLQVADANAYAELMANLKLPHPKYMDVAVPANLACGKA